ncbi:hypothetical protein APHAL10511_004482 [Amanita phalloides]|nr:hypothetical protein APHAL10511_004482 [Amanita phalloides]
MTMTPLFVNNYKPSARQGVSLKDLTDSSFVLPVPESIETERVKLVPFVPSVHAEAWYTVALQNPGYADYVPYRLATPDDIQVYYLEQIHNNPQRTLFAIIDKTRGAPDGRVSDGAIAGIIGAIDCMPQDLKVEIGPVFVFPAFRGTHVSEHAIGALLKYWLDVPSQGGMGFRRVAWTTNPDNRASVRVAEKMGFKLEGVMRWTWVLPEGAAGKDVEGERGVGKGRDTTLMSLCWDDWENGAREKVLKMIET